MQVTSCAGNLRPVKRERQRVTKDLPRDLENFWNLLWSKHTVRDTAESRTNVERQDEFSRPCVCEVYHDG